GEAHPGEREAPRPGQPVGLTATGSRPTTHWSRGQPAGGTRIRAKGAIRDRTTPCPPCPRRAGRIMSAAPRRLRIAQVAPPLERVPPLAYGGTERIVNELLHELVKRGHEVTVFASGDSDVRPARHAVTVPLALRPANSPDDVG